MGGVIKLAHPAQAQIHGLPTLLRSTQILTKIISQGVEVIWVETDGHYREKAAGSRVRILVQDIDSLPATINISGIQGGGVKEYYIEYSDLPTHYSRCKSTLAPYLFLFIADVLRYMLNDPKWQVQGLTLPDNSSLNNQKFADDTALFLKGTAENLTRAMRALTWFCDASGAKIN